MMTTSLQAKAHDTVAHFQQLHVPAVRAQVWPDAVERLPDAHLDVERMEPVKHEQTAYQLVTGQSLDDLSAGLA